MATAAKPDTLASAMAKAFAEIEGATKSATNPHFKSKYADLGAVIDAIKPALIANDLFFTQASHVAEDGVCVETFIHHSGGDSLSCGKLYVPANKRDAQGFGSALTYCRRYALMTAFGVPAEDDDGNAAARSAPANDRNGNADEAADPSHRPAPREKLDGPHTSASALKKAVDDIITKVRAAQSEDELEAIKTDHKRTINQALRDYPALINGDPEIVECVGLRGFIEMRRAALQDHGQFQMLIDSMKSCTSLSSYTSWRATNEAIVDELDDLQRREFERAADEFEAGLTAVAAVNAG